MPNLRPFDVAPDDRLRLIVESYQRLTGKALLDDSAAQPSSRWQAGTGVRAWDAGISTLSLTLSPQGQGDDGRSHELRRAVWRAPRAIVAHGTEEEPIFFYGNRLALQLFEMNFDQFVRLPSYLSAEPAAQESRERALKMVAQQGFVDGYSGVRISSTGKRFRILNTTIWNLTDTAGGFHGQAATFTDWQPL
ncbi:MAG TPA: MEKHLA domain-containing protein [Gallionella sp.]|nr:MEKHLA domain-containing protein [Gallionella sp.]